MERLTLASAALARRPTPESEPDVAEIAEVARLPEPAGRLPDEQEDLEPGEDATPRRRKWLRHPILLIVLLPTLLVAAFEYLVAADQYQSEAHFIVRGTQANSGASGLSQMLGIGAGPVPADAHSVGDYLISHDALAALGRTIDLPAVFRRPEADVVTRLWDAEPEPETLLRYYQDQVHVDFNAETGITRLSVRAFRREDAKHLADQLLLLGETRVNGLNERMLQDGLASATRQVRAAQAQVSQAQAAMTAFRQSQRDIDPERTSTAQIGVASQLEAQAAQARAQLNSMAAALSPSAPQYVAMARQVRALEGQAAAARARLAGPQRSTAVDLGQFEELRVRQEFAAKQYEAAAAALQSAREQLSRQQLFVVRVVEPNLPGRSLYPQRLKIVATVFFGLLLAYAIGWLILAGVREHAA